MLKRLAVLALLLFSPGAWAEYYYWTYNFLIGVTSPHFPSASAACSAFLDEYRSLPNVDSIVFKGLKKSGETAFSCYYDYHGWDGKAHSYGSYLTMYRNGDGCEEGKTYNQEKGKCEIDNLRTPEECAAEAGNVVFPLESQTFFEGCVLGCHVQQPLYVCGDANNPDATCSSYPVLYTGGYCDGENNDELPTSFAPPPPLNGSDTGWGEPGNDPDQWDQCPKGYIYSGTQCVKAPNANDGCPEGLVKQGTHCVTPGTEGSGDGEGSDNGSGNGNGNGSGNGNGNGNGNGSGSGNGSGDGNGSGEGDNEGTSSASGSCNAKSASVDCKGDAVMCAIYREQFRANCEMQALYSEDSVKEGIDYAISATESEVIPTETFNISEFFHNALKKSRWLPNQCVANDNFNVMGQPLSLSWQPVCDMASALGPFIVLIATVFFAVTVIRSIRS